MGLHQSALRLAKSRTVPDYYWWEGKDFAELAQEVLKDPASVRVVMVEGLTEDGIRDVWFKVVPRDAKEVLDFDGTEFNISHPCPPWCP